MPYKFRVSLSPVVGGILPWFTGGYVRGVFLDVLREFNANLANFIHDSPGVKPYAVELLRPVSGRFKVRGGVVSVERGREYVIGFKVLKDDLGFYFLNSLVDRRRIFLGNVEFRVVDVAVKKEDIRGFLNRVLLGRYKLVFHSPTFFKIRGKGFVYPMPDLRRIVANLLSIWNSFVPGDLYISIGPAIEAVEEGAFIQNVNIRTRDLIIEGTKYSGFTGEVELVITDKNPVAPAILGTLLKLAEYSNVGEKRTYGLGQVTYHRIKVEKKDKEGAPQGQQS